MKNLKHLKVKLIKSPTDRTWLWRCKVAGSGVFSSRNYKSKEAAKRGFKRWAARANRELSLDLYFWDDELQ